MALFLPLPSKCFIVPCNFATLPELWEWIVLPDPTQRMLDPRIKTNSTCLVSQLLGTASVPPVGVALSVLLAPHLPPALSFRCLVLFPAEHLPSPACRGGCRPPLCPRSHMTGHLFSLRSMVNSVSSLFGSVSLPSGTQKSHLFLLPSKWHMTSLLTDQEPLGEQDLSVSTAPTYYWCDYHTQLIHRSVESCIYLI